MVDYIAKAGEEKKGKIERNKKQQLVNQNGGKNKNFMANQSMNDKIQSKSGKMAQVNEQIANAKYATASLGKFDKMLKNEDKIADKGKKRKYETNTGDNKQEATRVKKIASSIAGQN